MKGPDEFVSNPEAKNILLIAVTGYGQEEDRRRSLEARFDYHLVKPLNFDELKTNYLRSGLLRKSRRAF
jgi:CheY-like chemotaxis protein